MGLGPKGAQPGPTLCKGPNGQAPTIFFKFGTNILIDHLTNLAEETHMGIQRLGPLGPQLGALTSKGLLVTQKPKHIAYHSKALNFPNKIQSSVWV